MIKYTYIYRVTCVYIYTHSMIHNINLFFTFAVPPRSKNLQEMMKTVVPGWARPCEMIGKEAGEYKLYGTTGEPCLFKRISPRDIEQGQEDHGARNEIFAKSRGGPKDDHHLTLFSHTHTHTRKTNV